MADSHGVGPGGLEVAIRDAWTRIGAAVGLALIAGVGMSAPALAQAQKASPDDAKRKLEAGRRALTEQDRREGELQSEVARLKEDEAQLRTQQLNTARTIQASEAQLSAIEQRQKELEAQADHVRGSLESKKGSLSGLLAAMQRMGRNPPPVMITRRQDALDMVRSAKLIAASAPELAAQANALADQLSDFIRISDSIRQEGEKLKSELARLNDAQTRLAALNDLRRQTLADRNRELSDVKRITGDIKREVADLTELITRTEKELTERTRLGQYERELAAEAARAAAAKAAESKAAAAATPPAEPAPAVVATAPSTLPPAPAPAAGAPTSVRTVAVAPVTPPKAPVPTTKAAAPSATLAPGDRMAMASPGRLQPAIAFADAKGRLPLPVQGRRVVNFGERTQRGVPFQGIAIQSRFGAQVVAPADGWVLFAGEFRSYGQILIINAGGGHHILLANLSQIDVQQGQFVIAGEPVGTMAPAPKGLAPARSGADAEGAPILYIEFKKDNRPIDPGPWWADPGRKNALLITPDVILPQLSPG